ncbi:uncharacterized protein LOC112590598 [Harpegnathos saltator]|uniref:uncharacterized protein LOC112590598 n=1 Tax=Harpegnathos saltator TaxID=610380 RepID=UPI000DBEE80F|nr:uncharacterized protein LOC112590598 [Harpegnathos saltator]
MNNCAITLPNDDNKWLSFTNYCRKERVPFVVYVDLKCILEKAPREKQTSSYAYQHHNVFSIAYYVRCSYNESLSAYRCRRDPDCISWFVKELEELAHRVKDILSANVSMETLSKEQWETFRNATLCHVCEKSFAKDDTCVPDHCHLTGRYRDPAHSNCNLNYRVSYCIPVVFHNLSGYDSHFIIKDIATTFEGKARNIQETSEFTVSGDGTWKKREFSSLYDVSSLIGYYTGKIIDIVTKSAYCKKCEYWDKKGYSGI